MKNKRAKILVLIGMIIVIIVISFVVISSNNSFQDSLNTLKNNGDINYILQDYIEKNWKIDEIGEVISERLNDSDGEYISKLGKSIYLRTFNGYTGEYELTNGMEKLSKYVINSDTMRNKSLEEKISLKYLLHRNIEWYKDYDFGFVEITKEEVEKYIEENAVSTITEKNKGGYFDNKKDEYRDIHRREAPLGVNGSYVGTYTITKEHSFYGDFMLLYYEEYWYNTPKSDPNNIENTKLFYKENQLVGLDSAEDIKKLKITTQYAFYYTDNNIYAYDLTEESPKKIILTKI